MTVDYIINLLESSSMVIVEQTRTGNNLGTVLKLANGAIVNCWDSGKVNCQGKNCKEVEALISGSVRTNVNRKVFVVYGHDLNARTQLEAMLRRWDLEPLIIDQLVSSGQTIIEKLEEYTDQVNFGIVLATPDDIGYAKAKEENKALREQLKKVTLTETIKQKVIVQLGAKITSLTEQLHAERKRNEQNEEMIRALQAQIDDLIETMEVAQSVKTA